MNRVIDTVNNEVRLEGDDSGWGYHIRQLAAAPAGAKRMDIVWKHWYSAADETKYTNKPWNHSNCFGFSFDGVVPKVPVTWEFATNSSFLVFDKFFGWATVTRCVTANGDYYDAYFDQGYSANAFATGVKGQSPGYFGDPNAYKSTFDGCGKAFIDFAGNTYSVNAHASRRNAYYVSFSAASRYLSFVPVLEATGLAITFGLRFYASSETSAMFCRMVSNHNTLTGDGMFDCFASPYGASGTNYADAQFLGDVVSNFRPSYDSVVFPS